MYFPCLNWVKHIVTEDSIRRKKIVLPEILKEYVFLCIFIIKL